MSRARVVLPSVFLALCASVLLPLCARGAVAVELAGRPLGKYPHYEHVNVFNANEPVTVGVDPTVSTGLVGVTCPVYVVAAKSASEWQGDPSLTDVRSGGPGTATFAAGSILANIVTVADPDELNADAGTRLGVGYDMVIDVDGDGQLSAPDHIDGAGDEAAFHVVGDTTAPGPLPATVVEYSATGVTPGFEMERIWYPADIGAMGRLPVVIISHGNGHQYTWYDYLQKHLASYGYVVMSHQNNTLPGIEACSQTTLEHADAFLGQLASIAGGALVGHIDSSRIVWIGQSRGGEGVVRAFDKLVDGEWTSVHYDANDIVLISSIAPTDFLGTEKSNPHGANYHLLYGSADGDVSGDPSSLSVNSFSIYERAEGYRQSTYVQGADHNDFNSDGASDFAGPPGTEIGREEAQQVAKGIYLPLIKHYVESSVPAHDFLWRQYEGFRPIGVSTGTVVVNEYKVGPANGRFVIDDYQDRLGDTNTSSSGGAVRFSVTGLEESLLKDRNSSISTMDPMNGMSRARPEDTSWGAVFQWATTAYVEFDVVPAGRDFTAFECLSLRACQIPRHPNTMAELDDLTFTVTLLDGSGGTSSINIGSYGGGIEEPYQREGGWQTEFETIRIPLDDFLRDGQTLDLGNVTVVRLDFGPSSGSAVGTIGLDDVELVKEDTRGGAKIVFDSAAVADTGGGNGDLLLNPGETSDLNVSLQNVGFYPSPGVTATLSTTDPYVSVLDAAAAFGEMPGGGPARMAQDPFTIQVAANCPTPHEASMVMNITDAGGTNWTASFDVVIYTSSQVSGHVTRDGVPEPGVTITWRGPLPGSTLTDANGHYMFGSIAGIYDVVASKDDWLSSAPAVVTIPSSTTGVDFAFTTAVISGQVTDLLSGGPVEGATITHIGGFEGSVQTDSSGNYTITRVYGRPTTLSLVAGHPSYFDSNPEDVAQPPDASNVDFQLGVSDIGVSPGSFAVTAAAGTVVNRQLTISNVGSAPLVYSIWNEGERLADNAGEIKGEINVPAQVGTRGRPVGVAFDGIQLWVSAGFNSAGFLYKLDPSNGNLLGTLPVSNVCERPYGLAWDGEKLWIAGPYDNKIYAIDPATGDKLKEFDAPDGIQPFSVAWDGVNLWTKASDYGSATIYKLDPDDGTLLDTVTIPGEINGNSRGMTYFNGSLWLPTYGGPESYKISPTTGEIIDVINSAAVNVYDVCGDGGTCLWMTGHFGKKLSMVASGDPPWLEAMPNQGSVTGSGTTNVTVVFDANLANPGLNRTTIHIGSNDPDQPDETVAVDFLVTTPYTISGTATLDGSPLADVTVSHTAPYSAFLQTEADGTYSLYASEATHTMHASYGDYLDTAPVDVTIPPSGTNVDFEFTTATLSGQVTDALTGSPVEGATITYSGALTGAVQTASDGTYSITRVFGRSATLSLVASHASYFDSAAQDVTVPPDVSGVDFTLGVPDIGVTPASITVTGGLHEAAGGMLTITNSGGHRLNWSAWNELNGATGAVSPSAGDVKRQFSIPTEIGNPHGAAFDGQVLWISNDGSTLYKLDPMDGQMIGELELGCAANVRGLCFDGVNLWAAGYNDGNIHVIDRETGECLKTFTSPYGISVAGIAYGEGSIWVMQGASRGGQTIYRVNPENGSVQSALRAPSIASGFLYRLTYVNGGLWFSTFGGDGTVYKISTDDGSTLSTFQGPNLPVIGISTDWDGGLWLADYSGKNAYLVDTGEPIWISVSPKGGTVPSLDSANVAVSFVGTKAGLGTHSATIHVRSDDPDEPDVTVDVTYVVTDDNQTPVINAAVPSSPHTMAENTSQAFSVTASDLDGDPLTYSWTLNDGTIGGPTAASYTYAPDHAAVGTHTLKVTVDDGWGGITSHTWTVIVEANTTLESWGGLHGLTGDALLPDADDDGDTVPLIQEYAFNLDPTVADWHLLTPGTGTSGLPVFRLVGDRIHGEFLRRRSDPDLTIFAEFSGDLSAWIAAGSGFETVTEVDSEFLRVIVTDFETTATQPRRAGRVTLEWVEGP